MTRSTCIPANRAWTKITDKDQTTDKDQDKGARPREEPLNVTVNRRLERECRWYWQIESERDEMMMLARDRFQAKEERQRWVYAELDRMYPPIQPPKTTLSPDTEVPSTADGQIPGLGDLPAAWPDLPAKASLSSVIGWVQAKRLRVVTERPGAATQVRLNRALSPVPSWAGLVWIETSIRSCAKFVDVAAKATSTDDGEAAVMKRERVSIEEMRQLLQEMRVHEDGACPRCGRQD